MFEPYNRRTTIILVGALVLVAVTASLVSAASPGDLDPTFDGDGKVTTHFDDGDSASGVVIQGDGKIVVAGSAGGAGGPTSPWPGTTPTDPSMPPSAARGR